MGLAPIISDAEFVVTADSTSLAYAMNLNGIWRPTGSEFSELESTYAYVDVALSDLNCDELSWW